MKIVIPAYEPDEKLLSLILSIQNKCEYEIVIVNDGSSPSSDQIFDQAVELGCTVLVHEQNRGKGAALKTAFSYLLQTGEKEGVVCADCDGQHTCTDILKIAEAVISRDSHIVLGSRKFTGTIPLKSLLGNKITCLIYSLVSGKRIPDTQTGLRGFSSRMLPWLLTLKGNRYEYEMNQLLEAKAAGYELLILPIETIYEENNRFSHFHPIRDSARIYLPILKFMLSSAGCGMIDFFLLLIINRLTQNLLLSVVAARAVSSLCNYFFNKNLVFRAQNQRLLTTVVKYYSLVVFILICNYSMLKFLVDLIGIPLVLGKLITELVLYSLSYIIQHKFIFKQEGLTQNVLKKPRQG